MDGQLSTVVMVLISSVLPCLSYYRDPLPQRPSWPGPPYGPPGTFMYYIQGKPKTGYHPMPRPPPPPPPMCPPEEPPPYEKYGPPFIPYCDFSRDNFCEYVDYYPAKLIDYLLRTRRIDVKSLLNQADTEAKPTSPPYVPTPPKYPPAYGDNSYPQHSPYNTSSDPYYPLEGNGNGGYDTRRGRHKRQNREVLCDTDTRVKVPRAARDRNGNNYYVANTLSFNEQVETMVISGRQQNVTQRECIREGLPCQLGSYCTPTSTTTSQCVQQLGELNLLVLEQNGQQLAMRPFQFYSACICTFTRR